MNKQWYESLQYLYLFGKGMVVLQIKFELERSRGRNTIIRQSDLFIR